MSFQKPNDIAERNKSLLRKKEVNKLRTDVLAKFSNLSEDDMTQILPNKAKVEQSKLMNKTLLYYVEDVPYFFDESGRNKLFPTLQLLWRFPQMLRTFVIHSQVSKFILNGADLMLPGVSVIDNLEGIEVDEVCAVRVLGNPVPFAVGRSLCSWEGILANNRRGKAMQVISCFNDLLSGMGMNFTSVGPNQGFLCNATHILPLQGWEETFVGQDIIDNEEEASAVSSDGESEQSSVSDSETEESPLTAPPQRRAEPTAEQRLAMGLRLRNALVLLLKHIVKDKALPMLANILWSQLLNVATFLYSSNDAGMIVEGENTELCLEDSEAGGVEKGVDVKRSQYRTVSSFLLWADSENIISVVENQEKGSLSVASVARTHPVFREVRLANPDGLKTYLAKECVSVEEDNTRHNKKLEITVKEMLKIPRNMREVFNSLAVSCQVPQLGEHITTAELKELLVVYFRLHKMESETDRAIVVVPFEDPLWQMAAHAPSAIHQASTSTSIPDNQESKNETVKSVVFNLPENIPQDEHDSYTDYDEYDGCNAHGSNIDEGVSAGTMVAGVWVPSMPSTAASSDAGHSSHSQYRGSAMMQFKNGPTTGKSNVVKLSSALSAPHKQVALKSSSRTSDYFTATPSREEVLRQRAAKKASKGGNKTSIIQHENPIDVRKDALMKYIVSKLGKCHSIQRYPGAVPIIKPGPIPKVELVVTSVRAKKFMTHLQGMEDFGVDLDETARDLQRKFAASASVGPCSTNPQKREVYVQGNLAKRAEDFLVNEYGFKRGFITTTLGKGVQVKK